MLDEEDLESIAELCRTHDRFAIADEIYEHITYDAHRHRCLALCEGMAERTLVVNSISKTGRATGWRGGWVITSPERTPALRAVHDNLVVQAPTPLQKGALSLLRQPRSFFAGIAEGYRQKRDLLVDGPREIGFAVTSPEGAYYLFADYRDVPALAALTPTQAAMFLIERVGLATVPGDNFYTTGSDGDRYLRFAFCHSLDTLQAAVDRLRAGIRYRGDAEHGRGCGIGAYPSAAACSSTSSAHWFRLLPDSSAASAALRCVSGLTRNITRPE